MQQRDVVVDTGADRVFQEKAKLIQPVLVVDAKGAALWVEGNPAHMETLRLREPEPLYPQGMRQLEHALELPLTGHWSAAVGDWVEKTYVPRKNNEEIDPEVQSVSEQAIRRRVTTRLDDGVASGPADPAAYCVRLVVRSTELEAELPRVMEAMGQRLACRSTTCRWARRSSCHRPADTRSGVAQSDAEPHLRDGRRGRCHPPRRGDQEGPLHLRAHFPRRAVARRPLPTDAIERLRVL